MEEARQVLKRLKRIEELERRRAPSQELLAELRKLVRDGEAWLRAEREPAAAAEALERCRIALDGEGERDAAREEVALLAR
jgi:hypothetical protein